MSTIHRHSHDPYTSQDVFHNEIHRIFAASWLHVGFAHELAVGDLLPISCVNYPLLLVRDSENNIRAFHNVCRHRGTLLVPEPRQDKAVITCRYHGWAYGLDGSLRSAPYFGGARDELPQDFAKSDHGLLSVRCEVWHGWIFVNLDGKASAFQEYIAPLARRVDHVDFANLRHLATIDLGLVQANWKFIMENSLENYHVPFVHRTTASQPLEDHFDVIDQACFGTGVRVAGDVASARDGQAPEVLDMNALYLGLWPTFIMAAYEPATIVTHLNLPVAADQTYRKVALFTTNKNSVEERSVKGWCDLEKKVADEDVEVFEAQQVGRSSPASHDGGILSPRWEIVVAEFRRRIAIALA